jgi:hypothetical protein
LVYAGQQVLIFPSFSVEVELELKGTTMEVMLKWIKALISLCFRVQWIFTIVILFTFLCKTCTSQYLNASSKMEISYISSYHITETKLQNPQFILCIPFCGNFAKL